MTAQYLPLEIPIPMTRLTTWEVHEYTEGQDKLVCKCETGFWANVIANALNQMEIES